MPGTNLFMLAPPKPKPVPRGTLRFTSTAQLDWEDHLRGMGIKIRKY